MADDDLKPADELLAAILDRDEADRRADSIANDPEVRRLREEIERLEREAKEEEARQEAERMAKPAPVSDVSMHVHLAVPVSAAPRLTAAKIKLATELRRLKAPPEVVADRTDRGRNTVVVRRGVQDDGFAVAPAQEVAAQTRSKRAGIVLALVGVLMIGGVIGAVTLMGRGEAKPQVAASTPASMLPAPEPRVEPASVAPSVTPPVAPVTSGAAPTPAVSASSKPAPAQAGGPPFSTRIEPGTQGSSAPASTSAPSAKPPSSGKPASSSDFNGIRF